jgi:hypothetical protein
MLKALIDQTAFDALDDAAKGLYAKQEDGTHLLQVEAVNGFGLENTDGLRSALSAVRTEKATLASEIKDSATKFGDLDPEAARAAIAKVADMANWDPEQRLAEARTQMEEQLTSAFATDKAALETKFTTELDAANSMTATVRDQLTAEMITARGTLAATKEGGDPFFLLPHIERQTRMHAGDDGQYSVEVIDSLGNARISTKSGAVTPMTHSELIGEMKANPQFAPAFGVTPPSGGGTPPGAATGAPAGTAVLARGDLAGIGANLEAIAKGKATIAS